MQFVHLDEAVSFGLLKGRRQDSNTNLDGPTQSGRLEGQSEPHDSTLFPHISDLV